MQYEIKLEISGLDEQTYNSIIDMVKNLKNAKVTSQPLLQQMAVSGRSELLCRTFLSDGITTSATKCRFCAKEKWEH